MYTITQFFPAIVLSILLGVLLANIWSERRRLRAAKSPKVLVVDGYAVTEEPRGEFKAVVLHLQLSDGAKSSYEFDPAHAYSLSDELVRKSARAIKPVSAGAA